MGISSPQEIDLEAIAWAQGAVVHTRPLDKCEATIVGSQTRAVITVNSRSIPTRRRYSLAHELGHWHFHKGRLLYCGPTDVEAPSNGNALDPERQADDFASDMILPNYLFRPFALKLKKPHLAFVREIAEEFQASLTATYLKLLRTDLFPLVLVCHGPNGRRWFRRANSIASWWFPRAELDPDSFAFDMVFNKAPEKTHPNKIGAGAWFEFRNCDRFEISEQSFHLPSNEVLTILTLPAEAIS